MRETHKTSLHLVSAIDIPRSEPYGLKVLRILSRSTRAVGTLEAQQFFDRRMQKDAERKRR